VVEAASTGSGSAPGGPIEQHPLGLDPEIAMRRDKRPLGAQSLIPR
jgi:hypothetical protein